MWRGEAVLRIAGGADDRVSDSDAFFRDRYPVLRPLPLVPDAERTARAAEEWTRWTMEILAEHEINRRRSEAGCRCSTSSPSSGGAAPAMPTFLERHGLQGTFIGDSAFLQGLARTSGSNAIGT